MGTNPARPPVAIRREKSSPGKLPETPEAAEVASRPPSVQEETSNTAVLDTALKNISMPEPEDNSSSELSDDEVKKPPLRHAHSLDSDDGIPQKNVSFKAELPFEQKIAVETATKALTPEQLATVQRRQDVVYTQQETRKGKGIDPREWGSVGIDASELAPETQEELLRQYAAERKAETIKRDRDRKKNRIVGGGDNVDQIKVPELTRHKSVSSSGHANKSIRRSASRAASQIAPTSSVGVALREMAKHYGEEPSDDDPSSSSSESDYSDVTDFSDVKITRHGKSKNFRKSRGYKKSSIKPIPPKEYDGSPNLRSYHRFILEGESYLKDGQVPKERQIRILAHFLTGKAYDYYMQKVAPFISTQNWDIREFFTEMFNYCFPLDYKQQMRVKLENLSQSSNQTVSEYVWAYVLCFIYI